MKVHSRWLTVTVLSLIVSLLSFSAIAIQKPNLHQTWQFETQGSIWSSIIINDQTAFFGSDDGYIYALNMDSKQESWKFQTDGMVRSTAAIDEQRVFFTSDDGYLYAISQKNGQLAWKTSLNDADAIRIEPAKGAPYRYDYGKSSPIVVDDTIYVGSADQHLYAIAKDTGSIKWKFKTNDFIRATPVYHNGVVYVGSLDNNLYAVDANSGSKNWDFSAYNVIVSAAAIIEDKIIVGSRDAYIYALDPQSGDVEWTYYFNDRSWVESTAIQGQEKGVFYIGTSDSKKLMKFDLKTGKEIWSAPTLGWTWPLPFIHEKTVYIGSMGAKGYWNDVNPGFIGVDTETGELKYQYTPQLLPGYVTGGVFGSPAVYNNKLYVPDLDGKIREFNL